MTEPVTDAAVAPDVANGPPVERSDRRRMTGLRLVGVYILIMAITLGLAAVAVVALQPPAPQSPCPPLPAPCANPPGEPGPLPRGIAEPPVRDRARTTDAEECMPATSALGSELILGKTVSIESARSTVVYDDCWFDVVDTADQGVLLGVRYRAHTAWVVVVASPHAQRSPSQMIQTLHLQDAGLNAEVDLGDYYRVNGPSIGYQHGEAVASEYLGQVFDATGLPIGQGRWTFIAATDGNQTIGFEVFDQQPEDLLPGSSSATFHDFTRQLAEGILKNVRWGAVQ